jgi:creatinine amidohydrolase
MGQGIESRYERMRPGELDALVKERPLAWLPIGTLEWHGPHLPVGLDALKAHALCLRIAVATGGAVLPAQFKSILGMMFPYTFRYPIDVFTRTVYRTLRHLYQQGFRVMFLITGHYPQEQVALLMGIAEAFMATHRCAVVALPEFGMAAQCGYYGDHAAMWETSLLMELCPELVSAEGLDELKNLRGFSLAARGVYGRNPAHEATRERGAQAVDVMVRNFTELAEELLQNPEPGRARRVHRDFFKDYIEHEFLLIRKIARKAFP